jgi:hypothetical protein
MAIFIPVPPWRRDHFFWLALGRVAFLQAKSNRAPTDTKRCRGPVSRRFSFVISTLQAVAWLSSMMV